MNFIEYVPLARVTMKELPLRDHLIHMAMGVVGEYGELVDAAKKVAIYDKPVDLVNYTEEIGDVLWYYAGFHKELGIDPADSEKTLQDGMTCPWNEDAPDISTPIMLGAALVMLGSVAVNCCSSILEDSESSEMGLQIHVLGLTIATTARALGVNLEEAMERNIAKLKARYGHKFTVHAALNRDLNVERHALEGGTYAPLLNNSGD